MKSEMSGGEWAASTAPAHDRRPRPTLCLRMNSGVCRAVLPVLAALSALLVCLSWTERADAYAWMIRHDYAACGTCHADPSGGELLTQYGRATSNLILSTQYKKQDPEKTPKTGVLWGLADLPDWLLLSGSYRGMFVVEPGDEGDVLDLIPVMQADLYGQLRFGRFTAGGSMGIAKVSEGSTHARPAQLTVGQGDQLNLISRTHYLGVDIGDHVILRAGRLNLPFGVRIPEHTAWVREATRTDRESDQQHGVAFSYTGEHMRGEFMGILGNYQTRLNPGGRFEELKPDAVRERGYSFFLEGLGSTTFAAGVSSKVTYARLDRLTEEEKTLRQAHGLTMRWAAHRKFSVLAEANALFRTRANAGYVLFTQADYEPVQGLHFLLTGEVMDQGLAQPQAGQPLVEPDPGMGKPKFGGWLSLDWFFFKQFEFRTDLILRSNESATILGQLHFYL